MHAGSEGASGLVPVVCVCFGRPWGEGVGLISSASQEAAEFR